MKEYRLEMLLNGKWQSLTHADGHFVNRNRPFTTFDDALTRYAETINERKESGKPADDYRILSREVTEWKEYTEV